MKTLNQTRAALLADALRAVSAVVLLTTLFLAPLNYGSTRPLPFETLIALCAIGGGAWLLAGAFVGAWSLPPWPAQLGIGLIMLAGAAWLLVLAPPDVPAFTHAHWGRIARRWPHSVVPREFGLLLAWAAAGALGFLAFCDLARDFIWRRAIAAVILVAGVAVATLGLLQNATGARGIFWEHVARMPGTFFGPFYHHTSAGAYLNLVWPMGLALALTGLQRPHGSARLRAVIYGSLAGVTLVLVAHVAHVSRFPQVIALGALVGFAVWSGAWTLLGRIRHLRWALGALLVALVLGLTMFGGGRAHRIAERWQLLRVEGLMGGRPAVAPAPPADWPRLMRDDLFVPSDHRQYPLGDRGAAYATALAAVADRPWFGWGPGGWTAAAAAHSVDPFIRTFFLYLQFTHSDYLQTVVEWGLIGATGWLLVLPAAALHAFVRLSRQPARDVLGAGAAVALSTVLVQATIDFPLQIPALLFTALALAAVAWTVPGARIAQIAVSPTSLT
ncbi:O-antigen ligase family protein [Opitutus terrae]|uniref:O-antigen polymerase n=1 Tax=Opitutus terrae (strain DSM 11246 / JCM 15787 / PB90-1) TaxID=452637 RepID=B1ZT69_OPITP|nr:O-antigen ligase family protein [Opitutus terrae]ACB76523.1 O-antigen polymerase [Opitutus terrae PB90-1]